jgi:hypothetical protein
MGPCIVSTSNKMQHHTVYLYLEIALYVSGGTSTHHQERIQLYLQHLVFVRSLLLSVAISWNRFECAVGGVRHVEQFPDINKLCFDGFIQLLNLTLQTTCFGRSSSGIKVKVSLTL